MIARVGQLDHVIAVCWQHGGQPSIGLQARRIVGRRDITAIGPGRRQPDRRIDPRANPRALRIDDDQLSFLTAKPEVIDVIPRNLPLHHEGSSGSTCASSKLLLSSFSATWGSWPTASRNGDEIPSSV